MGMRRTLIALGLAVAGLVGSAVPAVGDAAGRTAGAAGGGWSGGFYGGGGRGGGAGRGGGGTPPQSLDGNPPASCNYHDYRVLKPLPVDAGPIAPWFAQPGYGLQYQLDAALVPGAPERLNVLWLVDNGYLQRLT